jgi:rhodanese-related sulfurtransferase
MNEPIHSSATENTTESLASSHRRLLTIMIFVIVLVGLIPFGIYRSVIGDVPTISAEKAEQFLVEKSAEVALVDVRSPEEYEQGHLPLAISWPLDKIRTVQNQADLPAELQGKKWLLLCSSGIRSAFAAEKLSAIPGVEAYNVQGGMQAFGAGREIKCAACLLGAQQKNCESSLLPFRESPSVEQWTAVITGFVIKPTYTILSLVCFILLWRCKAADLTALRYAMIAFFCGENCCAANYLIYQDGSYLLEYLHIFGMLLCFGLVVFALLDGIDRRIIKYSDPKAACAALGLCRECIKYAAVPCGLQRMFLWMLPALMILCFMPLTADFVLDSYNTRILGTMYNYSHAVVHQLNEIRYLPLVALAMFAVSWTVLKYKKYEPVAWSKAFFSAGAGALGFSLFRMILLHCYRDNMVWFAAWEEITELLFILGIGITLAIFRELTKNVEHEGEEA